MIINSGVQETAKVIGTVDTSNSMRMNLTAQSYSLILENLYKDPLGAVLRELTTNAVEAHQMAGTTDKKVAIQLPSLLNTDLIIRDFGTGLTSDEIEKYLNCLFSSSKGEDNDAMGGFGLGSKSPLALVDSFNLVSVKNGIQYDYMWIKEKGQIPTPIFQGESKTTKQNGITITVPLGSSTKVPLQSLQRTVAASANRQLFAFQKQVMIVEDASLNYDDLVDISSKVFTTNCVLDLDNVSIYYDPNYSATSYSRTGYAKAFVQIGSVVYDYSFTNISFSSMSSYFTNLHNFIVAIKVPIGVLDLPMSREEVNITSQNHSEVTKAYNAAVADIGKHVKSLSFNPDTDAKGYYDQIKSYNQSAIKANSLVFKLYANKSTLLAKEKQTLDLYAKYADIAAITSPGRDFDKQYNKVNITASPSEMLLQHFRHIFKDNLRLTQLYSNGSREAIHYVDSSTDSYAYFFTTLRLPGNMRYKDLYSYIQSLHPGCKPMLIQTETIDQELIDVFTKHLSNLIEFHGATKSVVMKPVADQVLKDYSKSLKAATAAVTGVVASTEVCPGVRIIDLSKLASHDLRSFSPRDNGRYTYCSSLSGYNNYKVTKLVDSKGATVPQGPEYVPAGSIVLLTDSDNICLNMSEIPSNQNLNNAAIEHSLKNVVVYKVPTKTLPKTKDRLVQAGFTVYMTPEKLEDINSSNSVKASLPSFEQLTDTTSSTYKTMACGIIHQAVYHYFEFAGWRINTQAVKARVKDVITKLAVSYDGHGETVIKQILTNKSVVDTFISEIGGSSSYNRYNMTLSVEAQTLTEFKQAVEDTLIQLLKTTYTSDWQVDTNGFTDNRIYTSKTVNIFFSCLGYKL